MGVQIGAAKIIDRLVELAGPRASVAPGVLNDHGRSEAMSNRTNDSRRYLILLIEYVFDRSPLPLLAFAAISRRIRHGRRGSNARIERSLPNW